MEILQFYQQMMSEKDWLRALTFETPRSGHESFRGQCPLLLRVSGEERRALAASPAEPLPGMSQ